MLTLAYTDTSGRRRWPGCHCTLPGTPVASLTVAEGTSTPAQTASCLRSAVGVLRQYQSQSGPNDVFSCASSGLSGRGPWIERTCDEVRTKKDMNGKAWILSTS